MKKYEVTIQFVWQAEDRKAVWREVRDYINLKLRDLATLQSIDQNPLPDPEEWIALNEPIRGKRGTD